MSDIERKTEVESAELQTIASRGYWAETWVRFRRKRLSMIAFYFVIFLAIIAIGAPMIVGTKPIVCHYKGGTYFPFVGYYKEQWENPAVRFQFDGPVEMKQQDPNSWAVWPLIYDDPYRRVREGEVEGRPQNPYQGYRPEVSESEVAKESPPGDKDEEVPASAICAPSWRHPFGLTSTGHDVMAKMIHGTKIALLVGFVSMGIAGVIGITLGALAGFYGGWIDMSISRLIEVVMCIPALVLILALMAVIDEPTIWHMMAVIGLTRWTGIARLTRGEFLKLKEMEYVTAAHALGTNQLRIVFRHVLPNALAPVLVPITFGIAAAILLESGLSYLGFGAPPPNPSWGALLQAARANLSMWWLIVFPGGAIFLTVLAYNLIGEGLQESTDPRLRDGGK